MKASLVICTYNWPEALELVLKSIMVQKEMPEEVIIADDGSKEETKNLIESFKSKLSIPLHHVWQEDKGWRKSIILNKAIANAKGEYIIQIDGDCILHSSFVKDHLRYARRGVYLSGSRVNIQESFCYLINDTTKNLFELKRFDLEQQTPKSILQFSHKNNWQKKLKPFMNKWLKKSNTCF